MIYTFLIVIALSAYVLLVYRQTTKAGFYSANFGKTLIGLPLVTTAIVFAMQVNLLISLGMVGALSIVRFRTAIKDPLDLLFLFWCISIGIICGTGSYLIAIFLSVAMTLVLCLVDLVPNKTSSMILALHGSCDLKEHEVRALICQHCKQVTLRTHTMKPQGSTFIFEIRLKKDHTLVESLSAIEGVHNVSLLTHDGEVRV